jgi:hypothetical protein
MKASRDSDVRNHLARHMWECRSGDADSGKLRKSSIRCLELMYRRSLPLVSQAGPGTRTHPLKLNHYITDESLQVQECEKEGKVHNIIEFTIANEKLVANPPGTKWACGKFESIHPLMSRQSLCVMRILWYLTKRVKTKERRIWTCNTKWYAKTADVS